MPRAAAAQPVLDYRHSTTAAGTRFRKIGSPMAGQTAEEARDVLLTAIAGDVGFETLATRGSDWKDYQTVAVWDLKAALEAAFAAGLAAGRQG